MEPNLTLQHRAKSPLFWIGLIACIYQAVVGSLLGASGILLSDTTQAVLGAISVGLSAVLLYCNGNNPSLTEY